MAYYVGIDIGAVSATASIICGKGKAFTANGFERLASTPNHEVLISSYRRTRGKPLAAATEYLEEIIAAVGAENIKGVCLTGSGSKLAASALGVPVVNEFKAIAAALSELGVKAGTVFEMGGETSKYLRFHAGDGVLDIVDYSTNGDCAAGTGSFIDQQCGRLKYNVEEVGKIVLGAERAAQVAGRCSVFAKSDMIHAQQKGYSPAEVLRGLCNAVARNFRMAVVRSHPVTTPVAFIGGVAANEAVVRAMRETFDLQGDQLIVPPGFAHIPAIGAALLAASKVHGDLSHMSDLRAASDTAAISFPTTEPLNMSRVVSLRDRVTPYKFPGGRVDAYVGIDIGSVSTNIVVIDADGNMIKEIYVRTQGRPVEVVSEGMKEVAREWGDRINVRGLGTTGSGRELIGELLGADTINDEITCHKTGAVYVGERMLGGRVPDTIFEIGGQDAKFISLQDGIVVDFTMNEACAAGTGSFLEERAEELDIAIKGEFASLALSSTAPIRLGERCTVFMERDVNSYMQRGAAKKDLVAGLAYSVVYNYINRVVRGRKIGQCIFFQGGTAYNDAVAAAFSGVLNQEIIVPPYNGVIGAIGAALLARDKMAATGVKKAATASATDVGTYVSDLAASRFRGYDIGKVNYTLREFMCKGCSNNCQMQEFNVEGEKTYWGDKCSDRFRKQAKADTKPVIEDLIGLRSRLLMDETGLPAAPATAKSVGIPMTMFALEQLPFWRTFFANCGLRVVLSDPTNKKIVQDGMAASVAEPCFPIIVAHGHVANVAAKGVDCIFMPNIVSGETRWTDTESYLCPWHQTLPFVCRQAPVLADAAGKFLSPLVRFREGRKVVSRELVQFFGADATARSLNVSPAAVKRAVELAYAAQDKFRDSLLAAGREAMATLTRTNAMGIVIAGRPYNIHDAGVNLSVAYKLRDMYGVNCIPLDCLDVDDIDVRDINDNMFWNLGRKIIATAKMVSEHPNLHIIYITNFKCGPDSFIKHFIRRASGKPFLTLQFDGHSNDAGMMTRCEAYLDSKGILRPWRKDRAKTTTCPQITQIAQM